MDLLTVFSAICYCIGIPLMGYYLVKEWRQFRRNRAFFSDKQAVERLVQRIDEDIRESKKRAAAHSQHQEHLKRFDEISDKWLSALRVCVRNPYPTKIELTNARLAAKELTAVCQHGISSGYEGIDYEKIMADTLHLLNMLRESERL